MLVAWILSIVVCVKGQRRYLPLCILLAVGFGMEAAVSWMYSNNLTFVWMYHVYAIVEYALFSAYFMQLASSRYRLAIMVSVAVFAVMSAIVSYWYYHFNSYPGININMEGILVCLMCIYVLMTLDVRKFDGIQKQPDFWISLGLLVFYGGTFFSNGLYTYLLTIDPVQAKKLFGTINKPLNLILYACFIIGFICALLPRKSTLRLS